MCNIRIKVGLKKFSWELISIIKSIWNIYFTNQLIPEVEEMGRKFLCPYCGGQSTHWKGYRKTKRGRKRLRKCTDCKRKFSTNILL